MTRDRLIGHDLLQKLFEISHAVLEKYPEESELRAILDKLDAEIIYRNSFIVQKVLERAHDLHVDDEHEIDRDTLVHHNEDNGYWVMGWYFVADKELPKRLRGS